MQRSLRHLVPIAGPYVRHTWGCRMLTMLGQLWAHHCELSVLGRPLENPHQLLS